MSYTLNLNYHLDTKSKKFYWKGSFDIKYQNEPNARTISLQDSPSVIGLVHQLREHMNKTNKKDYYYTISGTNSNISVVIYADGERMEAVAQPLLIDANEQCDKLTFSGDILNYSMMNQNFQFFSKIQEESLKFAQGKYTGDIKIKIIKNISIMIALQELVSEPDTGHDMLMDSSFNNWDDGGDY